MKNILFLLISFSAFAAGNHFNGSFYNGNSNLNWVRNGSTLDLDFANNRYYVNGTSYSTIASFITGAGATFSRATTASYYNSAGVLSTSSANTPRLDYDPKTHESKGILIEEVRTNDILRSAEINNAPWAVSGGLTVTPDAILAPDGTMTAELITTTGSGNSYFSQTAGTYAAGTSVTRSIYAKAGTTSKIIFETYLSGPTYIFTTFDLSTLVVTPAAGVTGLIQNVGNGWYRLSASKTFTNSSATDLWGAFYVDTYGVAPAGKTIYLWGAQQETGTFSTSYIPTTTAASTRNLDSFSVPTAAWYNAIIGTFFARTYGQSNSSFNGYGRVIGGNTPISLLGFESVLSQLGVWNGSTNLTLPGTVTASPSQTVKMAHAWDQNTLTQSVSIGALIGTGSYSGNWASTIIYPGGSAYCPINASLMRITFFPQRLSDAGLKDFTR